jgi:serine/threonine-protein kinase
MDWGLAKADNPKVRKGAEIPADAFLPQRPRDVLDTAGALVGTPAYMSPEQANCQPSEIDDRTDVFLLGGILYTYLTLSPPLRGRDAVESRARAKTAAVPPPEEIVTARSIPPGLSRITMRALARSPRDRFQTVGELRDAVRSFRRTGGWFAARAFAAGTIILAEGEAGTCSYLITDGTCEVYRLVHGEKHILRTVVPGEVFGEVALFTGAPRSATVEAKTDVTALEVTPEALDRELSQSQWLLPLARAAAKRFRELDRLQEH